MTFDAFVDRIYDKVQNKNTKTLGVLRQATVDQLKELSLHRTLFMEGTASFTTEADRETYDENWPGFPKGIMAIDRMWYTVGLTNFPIRGPLSVDAMRFNFPTTVSRTHPEAFAWQGRRLLLNSVSSALAISFDFFRDATRDTVTGGEISDSPFTADAENPWFERGELVLRNAVLAAYYSEPTWRDAEAAATCRGLRNQYLDTIQNEYWAKKFSGAQLPAYLGGLIDEGTHKIDAAFG